MRRNTRNIVVGGVFVAAVGLIGSCSAAVGGALMASSTTTPRPAVTVTATVTAAASPTPVQTPAVTVTVERTIEAAARSQDAPAPAGDDADAAVPVPARVADLPTETATEGDPVEAEPADVAEQGPAAPRGGYDNCSQARADGAAPLTPGDPGWSDHLDRDDDGVACES